MKHVICSRNQAKSCSERIQNQIDYATGHTHEINSWRSSKTGIAVTTFQPSRPSWFPPLFSVITLSPSVRSCLPTSTSTKTKLHLSQMYPRTSVLARCRALDWSFNPITIVPIRPFKLLVLCDGSPLIADWKSPISALPSQKWPALAMPQDVAHRSCAKSILSVSYGLPIFLPRLQLIHLLSNTNASNNKSICASRLPHMIPRSALTPGKHGGDRLPMLCPTRCRLEDQRHHNVTGEYLCRLRNSLMQLASA